MGNARLPSAVMSLKNGIQQPFEFIKIAVNNSNFCKTEEVRSEFS